MLKNYFSEGYSKDIIKSYISRYKKIRNSKYVKDDLHIEVEIEYRHDINYFKNFHDLIALVDYVENKINLDNQDKSLKKSYHSDNEIETDGKPVYKDSEMEVWYADSPRACIKYKGNFPYNWCVSADTGVNMYSTHRFKEHEPAFYFVKQLKKIDAELNDNPDFPNIMLDKYHFFVIQVFKNVKVGNLDSKFYYVTSALNDGEIKMSWNEIIEKVSILKDKQEIFKAVPHSETEKADYKRFNNRLGDEEFSALSVEDKRKYLDIYISQKKLLSNEQFMSMPKSLQKLYIGFGVPIKNKQFDYVKNNSELLKYYSMVLKRRLEKFDEGVSLRFTNDEVLYILKYIYVSKKFYDKYYKILDYDFYYEPHQIDIIRINTDLDYFYDRNIDLTDNTLLWVIKNAEYCLLNIIENGYRIKNNYILKAAVDKNRSILKYHKDLVDKDFLEKYRNTLFELEIMFELGLPVTEMDILKSVKGNYLGLNNFKTCKVIPSADSEKEILKLIKKHKNDLNIITHCAIMLLCIKACIYA